MKTTNVKLDDNNLIFYKHSKRSANGGKYSCNALLCPLGFKRSFLFASRVMLLMLFSFIGVQNSVFAQVDVYIQKTANDNTVEIGQEITYTITVFNATGSPNATGIEIQEVFPAGVTYVAGSANPSVGTYNETTHVWDLGALDGNTNRSLVLKVTIDAGTAGDVITNTATVLAVHQTDLNTTPDAFESITVFSPDIEVTKSVDETNPAQGQLIQYTIEAANVGIGATAATGLQITDLLPTGLTYNLAGSTIPAGTTYDPVTGIWDIDTLLDNVTLTLVIGASSDLGTIGSTLTNTASVTAIVEPESGTSHPANNSASVDIDVNNELPDILVTKAVDENNPAQGELITYTVKAKNVGSGVAPATGLQITDLLPTGLTYNLAGSTIPVGTTYDPVTGIWDIGTLLDNVELTLLIGATSDVGTIGTTITNTASVGAIDQTEESTANNSASVNITVSNELPDILVTKAVDENNPAQGELITYTVKAKNVGSGVAPATGLQITDLLPAGLTYNLAGSAIPVGTTYDPITGIWDIGTLLDGVELTLLIGATSDLGTSGTTITNTASVSAIDQTEESTSNNSASVNITINSDLPDILVTKVANNSTQTQGVEFLYTIKAKNVGSNAPASGLIITDILDAGLDYNVTNSTIPAGTSYNSTTGEWVIGSLDHGVELALILAVTPKLGTGGTTISNTAELTAIDQAVVGSAIDSATYDVTIRQADIQVTKTVSAAPWNEGENLFYTINANNIGTGPASGLQIKDLLPAVLTYDPNPLATIIPLGTTYDPVTGIWDIGDLAAGADIDLIIAASPNEGSSNTDVNNVALVEALDQTDANLDNDRDEVSILVSRIDLELDKTISNTSPVSDATTVYVYSIVLTNLDVADSDLTDVELGDASSIEITDKLPDGVSFVSFKTIPSLTSAVENSDSIYWFVPDLANGQSRTLEINVTIDLGQGALTITNTAEIIDYDQIDGITSNNTASVDAFVKGADLEVRKTVDIIAPNPGDEITYRVVIINNGPDQANNITLTDLFPSAGLTYLSATNSQGDAYNSGAHTWFANDIPALDSAVLTITAEVLPGGTTLGNSYTNTAYISGVDESDANTSNDTSSVLIAIGEADLGVTKTASTPLDGIAFDEGETVTYTLVAENYGPNNAPLVEVLDLLPSEVTYTGHSGGTYNPVTGIWDIGSLNNGSTATLTITATINSGTAGRAIANIDSVSSPMNEPGAATHVNADTAIIQVHGADLEVTKVTTAAAPIVEEDAVQYVITLTNNGPDDATGIEVLDFLPLNLTFVSATPSEGSYDEGTGLWTGLALTDGETQTLTINTTINSGGGIFNTASVTASSELDSYTDNNTSSVFISALKSFEAGACIIDMGGSQTQDGTLKAYGLLYTLVETAQIPVYWAIRPDKTFQDDSIKVDETDFTVNGVDYKTGAFIIDADFAVIADSIITSWSTLYPLLGAKINCEQPAFEAPIYDVLTSFPRAVLDEQNGGLIESAFYDNIGLTNNVIGLDGFGEPVYDLYRPDGLPSNLDFCDDIYAMPHADPHTWDEVDKGRFDAFIKNGGWVWLACHAPSSLETLVDIDTTVGPAPEMNYLTEEGLVLWGDHGDGTPAYSYSLDKGEYSSETASDPFMQFVGNIDAALQSGSEQIYIPFKAGWRPTTTIAVWDPDHPEREGDGAYPKNAAALVAYGRAFGNPDYGMVVYEASHTIASGSEAENVGAARIYGNFWLQAGIEFRPVITPVTIPDQILGDEATHFAVSVEGRTPTFTYQWESGCGGTFTDPNDPETDYIAPLVDEVTSCVVRLVVTDECGRSAFLATFFEVFPKADLAITKTAPATINAGENITYTISVTNAGPSDGVDVVVEDILPAGLTLVSASPSVGSWTAPYWNVGTVAMGDTPSIEIIATVNSDVPDGTVLKNTATVTTKSTDENPANDTDSASTTVSAETDLAITKVDDVDPVLAGNNLTYTITVENLGPSDALDVEVEDVLPTGLTVVSVTPSGAAWTAPNWTIGTIPAGTSVSLTIVATVDSDIPTGTILSNTATVSTTTTDTDPGNDSATETTEVGTSADLKITKVDDVDPILAGNDLTYTITVENLGPSDAHTVIVNDVLPGGLTLISATPTVGTWTSPNWDIGTLTSGQIESFVVVATVNSNVANGTLLSNTASLTSVTPDPVPGNNSATETTLVNASADLTLLKLGDKEVVSVGENLTYTITLTNNGPSDALDVEVNDVLPVGLTVSSITVSQGGTWAAPDWSVGTLTSGTTATLTIVTLVTNGVTVPSTLTNTAIATTTTTDPNTADNTSTETTEVLAPSDLAITKSTVRGIVSVGETVTFVLDVVNNGPGDATGVIVSDLLPDGYTYVSHDAPTGTTYSDATGDWTIGSMINGASLSLEIVVTVDSSGPFENTATVSSNTPDSDNTNNTSSVTPEVRPIATDNIAPAQPAGMVTQQVITEDDGSGIDMDPDGTIEVGTVNLDPGSVPGGLGSDTDNDGDIDQVIGTEGTWAVDNLGNVSFTPAPGFNNDPTPISYTVQDNDGNTSNPADIGVDYVPVSTDDISTYYVLPTSVQVDVLGNDTTGDAVDPATVQIVGTANPGDTLVVAGEGKWSVDPVSGVITFDPEPGFMGDPTPISYTVKDNDGNTSNPSTVTVRFVQTDISAVLRFVPGIVTGTSDMAFQITVQELVGFATNGMVTVVIPKDGRLSFTYNPSMTIAGPYPTPDNSKWTYDGTNADFHVWTSTAPIPAFGKSKFGFVAQYDPEFSNGEVTYTVTIISGSGSENNDKNNIDTELLKYFNN